MVKIDGEVKQITTGRKLDSEGNPKLVARVLIEFVPTERGISELQDLLAMQELDVHVTIAAAQYELPISEKTRDAILTSAPEKGSAAEDTLLGHPIVEDPLLKSGEFVFGTVEQIGDPDLATEPSPPPDSTPEQLEAAADALLEGAPPAPKACAACGHPRGERFKIEGEPGKLPQRFSWKTIENDQGTFEQCPKCAHLNSFPEEGGGTMSGTDGEVA